MQTYIFLYLAYVAIKGSRGPMAGWLGTLKVHMLYELHGNAE